MAVSRRCLSMLVAVTMLSGCMEMVPEGLVSRMDAADAKGALAEGEDRIAPVASIDGADASEIIYALQARPTAIASGSSYDTIAAAVIASDSRVAEAELRVAQLRAEAARRNWMPSIGPRVSLNSLGEFVADLVIQQVLFDNGRKRAERDLAKANVEIAAVNLVDDGNKRVFDALSLYLKAEQNRALSTHLGSALTDMGKYEWVVDQRVLGGVSDPADLNILRQKLASLRARAGAADEAATTAIAELNAMSARNLSSVRGLGKLRDVSPGEALAVVRARAEREQAVAQAKIARAQHLPGLTASASGGQSALAGGIEVTTDSLFSLGTMAEFKAIEATKESAERKVAEASEVAARQITSQSNQWAAFQRQATEARTLTAQAKQNLDLYQQQFEGGLRQVMDVVQVYETYAAALERELDLTYKAARAELELARLKGALAEGADL